jgi:hypothetical protein
MADRLKTKSNHMKGNLYAVPEIPQILPAIAQPMYSLTPDTSHVTLGYNVDRDAFEDSEGLVFSAPAVAHCWSDRAQCLRIILPAGIPWLGKDKIPHLTLSWPQGSAAVQSGLMLQSGNFMEVVFSKPIPILFRVKFSPYAN